jgi:hypothetical protein
MSDAMPPENPTPSESETTRVASSNQFIEISKTAVLDTWGVFKLIWKDPANGFQDALATLGDDRAFNTGIALSILFVLACWIAILKVAAFVLAFAGAFGSDFSGQFDISIHLRIILSATIPVLGAIAVFWGIKKIFKGTGNYKQFTFITGVALAPITLFLLLLWLFGVGATDLITLLSLFCFTTFILLLNAALIGVLRLSSRNALLLVPLLLVADTFITRVAFEILY